MDPCRHSLLDGVDVLPRQLSAGVEQRPVDVDPEQPDQNYASDM